MPDVQCRPAGEALSGSPRRAPVRHQAQRGVVHQAVVRQLANARQGTHDTPHPRRGRGRHQESLAPERHRARPAGLAQGARTGAVAVSVFGPHPRDLPQGHAQEDAPAARCARRSRPQGRRRRAAGDPGADHGGAEHQGACACSSAPSRRRRSQLVVLDRPERNVQLSARNLPNVRAITTGLRSTSVRPMLRYEHLVAQPGSALRRPRGPPRRAGVPTQAAGAEALPSRPQPSRTPARRRSAKRGPELNVWDVLRQPRITEKGTMLAEESKYVFEVHPDGQQDPDQAGRGAGLAERQGRQGQHHDHPGQDAAAGAASVTAAGLEKGGGHARARPAHRVLRGLVGNERQRP